MELKRNNGITLIALVITIIILLILAGITINQLTGENGLFTRAKEAKEKTEQGTLEEDVKLKVTEKLLADDNKSLGDYVKEIKGVTVEELALDTWYVTRGNAKVTVTEEGEVTTGKTDIWDGSTTEPTEKTSTEIHIYTCAELKWLEEQVNAGTTFEGYTVYLENDLDLGARANNGNWETAQNEEKEWTPIGTSSTIMLKALFEGNNHIIKGVYVNNDTNFNGIFGNSNTVQNLTVKNSYIKGGAATAGIVGALRKGILENCHNENTTVILIGEDKYTEGGVVGQFSGTEIKNCSNTGNIIGNKKGGGIAGQVGSSAQITQCYNTGTVTGNGEYIGGIVGQANSSSQITQCYNTGAVTGNGERIGGIVGNASSSSQITQCYNTGKVTGNEGRVGGIVGVAITSTQITQCYNTGAVTGNGERIGGIVGNASSSSQITQCYNTGKVTGNGQNTGGIAGIIFGTVDKCYNAGNIKGKGENTGGVVGSIGTNCTAQITNCYNIGNVDDETGDGVGGVVGWVSITGTSGTIKYNYNIGKVTGATRVGGVIGKHDSTEFEVSNNYTLENVAPESSFDEKKTLEEMKTQNFINLLNENQTDTVWKIESEKNNGYPILNWQ